MKEFNLKEALDGKKVVTRGGDAVTQLHIFESTSYKNLFGVMNGSVFAFSITGNFLKFDLSPYDLFMAPVEEEAWINIRRGSRIGTYRYNTKGLALANVTDDCIATIKIKWCDG